MESTCTEFREEVLFVNNMKEGCWYWKCDQSPCQPLIGMQQVGMWQLVYKYLFGADAK